MEKPDMKTMDQKEYNLKRLKEAFPELVVETNVNGNTSYCVDSVKFNQLFNDVVAEGGGNVMNSPGPGNLLQ